MPLTFQTGLINNKRNEAVRSAVEAVMESTTGKSGSDGERKFIDEVRHYDCEAQIRKALHQVARQLLDQRVTFSDYLREPWLLRKISLRQAVENFQNAMIEYMHASGQGAGQLRLMQMDEVIGEYLRTHSEGIVRSA